MILGGGTAGTLAANRLRREFPHEAKITVVDRDDHHVYQPGLLFVPFDEGRPPGSVRSRARQLRWGVGYCFAGPWGQRPLLGAGLGKRLLAATGTPTWAYPGVLEALREDTPRAPSRSSSSTGV